MGRLSGFKYQKIIKKLTKLGIEYHRQGKGSHELWINPLTETITTIPKHTGDMPEGLLRVILKEFDIDIDSFLNA